MFGLSSDAALEPPAAAAYFVGIFTLLTTTRRIAILLFLVFGCGFPIFGFSSGSVFGLAANEPQRPAGIGVQFTTFSTPTTFFLFLVFSCGFPIFGFSGSVFGLAS